MKHNRVCFLQRLQVIPTYFNPPHNNIIMYNIKMSISDAEVMHDIIHHVKEHTSLMHFNKHHHER